MMKTVHSSLLLSGLALTLMCSSANAQNLQSLKTISGANIHMDSLQGFDFEAANKALLSGQYFGDEYTFKLSRLKRAYINDKYNLWPKPSTNNAPEFNGATKISVVPGCNNEDFEASASGTFTTPTQISGWTVTRGDVNFPNDACNLTGCCPTTPLESNLIDAPNGYVDPLIGACYPIFSVFGTNLGNANGPVNNPQLAQAMYGNKFLRINSDALGSLANSVEKLSKTIVVTTNNALFQFAYIFVTSTGHQCCGAGAFQFKLTNVTTNSILACPGYSIMGPSSACMGSSLNPVSYYLPASCATAAANSAVVFNKWKIAAADLTPYIGQTITIDVIVSDCDASGHFGYAYIDAQCGPMGVSVNNQPIYSNTVMASSCSSIAAFSAPGGFSSYNWTGPAGFTGSTSAVTTTVPGTYVVAMGGGQCASTTMTVQLSFAPNSLTVSNTPGFLCAGQTATLSASAMSSYTWSTGSSNQTITVTPAQTTTYALAATDASNCVHLATLSINVYNPVLTISSAVNTICPGASLQLNVSGAQTFTWSTGSNGPSLSVSPTVNSVFTATGTDTNGCLASSNIYTVWVVPCVGSLETEKENGFITLFPNPNKGEFTVELASEVKQAHFELYSLEGKLLLSQALIQGKNKIKIEKLSTGVYYYAILNHNIPLKQGKLQIE